jgi:WD40 repeat protein
MYTIHALVGYGDGVMVSGSMDKMVKVWDGRSAELLKVLDQQKFPGTGHSHAVNALCQLPLPKDSGSRRLLASAGDDKSIRIWELEIS